MPPVPGVEKRPLVYDEYKSTLEPKYLAIARNELHEDDYTRDPALAQMREFIAKHPQIQSCRTDALFLLRFLRSRKFNVVAACQMLEKWMETCEVAKDFFVLSQPESLDPLTEKCIIVPLGQDTQGRLVVTVRFGQFDPDTMTAEEQSRLTTLALETFMDNEIYQICGLVVLFEFTGATMAHFSVWTLPKLKLIMTAMSEILTYRIKEIHALQVPRFAAMVVDYCVATLSPKLRQRMRFHKSVEELKGAIDVSILPTIYGGQQSLEEANEKFRKRALQERDRMMKQAEMFIDLSIPSPNAKNSNAGLHSGMSDESVVGSFRKLNVD